MTTLNLSVTPDQVIQLVRQMTAEARRRLMAILSAERFSAALAESDRARAGMPPLTDEEIQEEIDAARVERRNGQRATGR